MDLVTVDDAVQGRAGNFTFDPETRDWTWDGEAFRVHGFTDGEVDPSHDLVLELIHPEDRERLEALLEKAGTQGEAFSAGYRVNAHDDVERRVVIIGEASPDSADGASSVNGYWIDITSDFQEDCDALIAEAVQASAEHRATIEQAKGALMLGYGIDSDAAFAMLRWWSRNRNMKLRDLASDLTGQISDGGITDQRLRLSLDAVMDDLTHD